MKVLITTVPFGQVQSLPLDILDSENIDYLINPLNKKLTESELFELVPEVDIIIAGTEIISERVMNNAKNLKFISRVGIGLDSVDLIAAQKKGIKVSYTPDAPTSAVAELTIGLMLSLIRSVQLSNIRMHKGHWERFFGKRISNCKIGIIGMGRIGSEVIKNLSGFKCETILINDIVYIDKNELPGNVKLKSKEEIYKEADIITLHVPLTSKTKDMIKEVHLKSMKSDAVIINTARGSIINEDDLYKVMKSGHLGGAAIDVFNFEPYCGKLSELENLILTAHMGSMSKDCRAAMEIEATEEVVRFIKNQPLQGTVPNEEYIIQKEGL